MKQTEFNQDLIQQPNHEQLENNRQLTDAIDRYQRGGMLAGLFDGGERNLIKGKVLNELQIGFSYRESALKMQVDSRLAAMEEYCNHALMLGKGELRQKRNLAFAEKFKQLQAELDDLTETFNLEMDERLQKVAQYKNPRIREREQRRLEARIDQFFDIIDKLISDFCHIIHESVKY